LKASRSAISARLRFGISGSSARSLGAGSRSLSTVDRANNCRALVCQREAINAPPSASNQSIGG
jgi:hypothetical protein